MAMARLRMLVRNLASPPRRAARWEWRSQITMTTGLQTYSSPTMAYSNISFITMAMELSQNGLSKPVLDCPKMAGVYPAWAWFFKITIMMAGRTLLSPNCPERFTASITTKAMELSAMAAWSPGSGCFQAEARAGELGSKISITTVGRI